jgi:hypothetical protein
VFSDEVRGEGSAIALAIGGPMPKAKPVSLHPLAFDDAVKALIVVNPDRVGKPTKKEKPKKHK